MFAQAERRSFLLPILLALVALGVAVAVAIHYFPATTIDINHVRTEVASTRTVFSGSPIAGVSEIDETLFVASTVRIDNQLRVPIYLDNFHLTVTNQQDQEMTVKAAEKKELPDLQTNFAALKPLLATPLLRDLAIEPGKAAEGTLLFPVRLSKNAWDARKSAVIKVDVYHQPAVYVTIPK